MKAILALAVISNPVLGSGRAGMEISESRTELFPGSVYGFPSQRFLVLESVIADNPFKEHRATVLYLDGSEGAGRVQLMKLKEKGLFTDLETHVRLVAPVMADSDRNPIRGWFPLQFFTWQDSDESIATRSEIEESAQILLKIIDREAERLGGDYSRIFIIGYSRGAMMAQWLGLMSNRPFGGVVALSGGFPVFDIDEVSPAGREVVIYHLHDPLDIGVLFKYAEKGLRTARAAGARGYSQITETNIAGKSHHGLSSKICGEANIWLVSRLHHAGLI